MTTLTAQQIACVYAWLAQLFSRELDDEQLTQIASAQMAEWFSLLKSEPPLTAAVNDHQRSVRTGRLRQLRSTDVDGQHVGVTVFAQRTRLAAFIWIVPCPFVNSCHAGCIAVRN